MKSATTRQPGVTEAVVVDVDDPAREGRVRVKLLELDDATSGWCRVCQLYAGNGYGAVFVPEPGDEVLVAFAHGDMSRPVVLGGLYGGKDKPPTSRDGATDQKLIRTRGNHELLLDDSVGRKGIRLKTDAGHRIDLDDQAGKATLATASGHKVELDDVEGTVTVTTASGQSVVIGVAGAVTIHAARVTVSARRIDLGREADQPLVLGASLLTLFNSHTHVSSAPGGPTTPPLPPMTPAHLSAVARTE